ncbi:OsmC family protein [Hydrogenophaga sp.]|uniref:OsmC family protein n=1 Tax=Hydrogenophaga sp. TaxID=1904254 RepID=UPI002602B7D5|nr:OsmC family protein [Hydrogenophaga sp.]MCW5655598.1 OsmC family protein [Hydrogenophaga sp.]
MTPHDAIAAALERVQSVLRRKPEVGLHDDAPATARWQGGTRMTVHHANGTALPTDMPAELGGTGDQVTPGWLFRAGLSSCAATSILLQAVQSGVALTRLEVRATSRSDTRGLLGMADADGQPVPAGPCGVTLEVSLAADGGVPPERLRALVHGALGHSPVPCAVRVATPMDLRIEA